MLFTTFFPVSFQPAVEIVEFDAGNASGGGIEEFARQRFAHRVETLLLPSGYQIVSFLPDHPVKLGDFIRRVLQVGVHGDDHVSLRGIKPAVQGCRLPVISSETYPLDVRVFSRAGR